MNRVVLHEDPTTALRNAFSIFDQFAYMREVPRTVMCSRDGTGLIDASEFRNVMGNLGERFTIPEGVWR